MLWGSGLAFEASNVTLNIVNEVGYLGWESLEPEATTPTTVVWMRNVSLMLVGVPWAVSNIEVLGRMPQTMKISACDIHHQKGC